MKHWTGDALLFIPFYTLKHANDKNLTKSFIITIPGPAPDQTKAKYQHASKTF